MSMVHLICRSATQKKKYTHSQWQGISEGGCNKQGGKKKVELKF